MPDYYSVPLHFPLHVPLHLSTSFTFAHIISIHIFRTYLPNEMPHGIQDFLLLLRFFFSPVYARQADALLVRFLFRFSHIEFT